MTLLDADRHLPEPHAAPLGAATGAVRIILQLEGLLVLAGATTLYALAGASWLVFALLFLAPDLSMLGYLAGPRAGSASYNAAHSYLAPGLLATLGFVVGLTALYGLALIWIAHIGFDRALGYGLKYCSSFGDTHLGRRGDYVGGLR